MNENNLLKNKTILIVDDSIITAKALSLYLKQQGLNVLLASTGMDALQVLKENQHINLVLMDVMMPDMGGYQAIEIIRKQEKYKNLPIFVLTAREMKGDEENAKKVGADLYIQKPVDFDGLLQKIEKIL